MTNLSKYLESVAAECAAMDREELTKKCVALEQELFINAGLFVERVAENDALRKQMWIVRDNYAQAVKRRVEAVQELGKLKTELDGVSDSLCGFQNEVWSSMGRYSNSLGWGLTGIQPECWVCLDSAVDELREKRDKVKQLTALLRRLVAFVHLDGPNVYQVAQIVKKEVTEALKEEK